MSCRQHIAVVKKQRAEAEREKHYDDIILPAFDKTKYPGCTDEELDELEFEHEEMQHELSSFYLIVDKLSVKEDFTIGTLDIENDIGEPFYKDSKLQECMSDYLARVINREDFAHIIDIMREFIYNYYTNLMQKDPDELKAAIKSHQETWLGKYVKPYNLDTKRDAMVNSLDAEHQIWDMVRIYREVDWDNEEVIFFRW